MAFVGGLRQLIAVGNGLQSLAFGGLTDDRGEYRIFGLAPGTYYLAASYGSFAPGRSDDRVAYATTYYPGSPSVAAAGSLRVAADEVTSADFALSRVRLAEIRGRVVNSFGESDSARLNLRPVAAGHAIEAGGRPISVEPGGVFTIRGVAAGDYRLQATTSSQGRLAELAVVRVTVGGADISNLVVVTAPTATASGQFVMEGANGDETDGLFVAAMPTDVASANASGGAGGLANRSGGFALAGIVGPHVLRLNRPPPGVWVKSITINDRDATDVPYDFQAGESASVDIVVTRRMAGVSGTVRDSDGRSTSDASVIVFSTDERRWGPHTRAIATATPEADGTFSVQGLPPGEYAVIAVPPLEAGEEGDPERLSTWLSSARRATLTDAAVSGVALTLAR